MKRFFFSVINLDLLANFFHYYEDPTKELPPGAKYAVRFIHQPSSETWQYYSSDIQILTQETISPVSYDPRQDSWLADMKAWPGERWDNAYFPRGTSHYVAVGEPGITVSVPVFDKLAKFKAVGGGQCFFEWTF